MVSKVARWFTPLKGHHDHVFWDCNSNDVNITRNELIKMHQQFYHPSEDKPINVLLQARPDEVTSDVRKIIHEISDKLQCCNEHRGSPFRFKASLPSEDIIFNHELTLDLFWLAKDPVLHIIYVHTNFQTCAFLTYKSFDGTWTLFVHLWATIFQGYPDVMRIDQESTFKSQRFEELATAKCLKLQFSMIESHNSIGKAERYPAPLLRVFQCIERDHPNMDKELVIRFSLKAINASVGPQGLVPTLFLY